MTLDAPATTLLWRVACLFGTMALSFTPIVVVGIRTIPASSLRMAMGMMRLLRGLSFHIQGDWEGMAAHKAMAVLNGQLHTEAALWAYKECYLGLALLHVMLLIV